MGMKCHINGALVLRKCKKSEVCDVAERYNTKLSSEVGGFFFFLARRLSEQGHLQI